ncbi:DUF2971 domain-containing protein [Brumimicrobium aurantiacum]|uniref:DUF2971 domain-containing protein n=1 Tax=Brumimicrobium aurantiacum TaxID=1737063 RepID=A0A3E1EUD7_9FLAO|nr:DUF2971 domain-containing protein [Brumimicrobium aurantiacum]RFC53186.1 DUF2971 domain-containing protein [Brumimicrobium aurantiacum]
MNIDEKIEFYLKGAREFFPHLKTSTVSSFFGSSEPTSGEIEFRSQFINEIALKESPLQFIHYTSLSSAMNILNSGNIRLYNCLNLNDPSEINYLLKNSPINFTEKEVEKYKREHFILSGSIYKSKNDEEFNLWRLYGDQGKGIGIVFEVDNKIENWTSVFLQTVTYGANKSNSKNIIGFLHFHKVFNEEHKLFSNTPSLFSLLSTGVKNEMWSIEKEFRIVIKLLLDKHSNLPEDSISNNSLITSRLNHELKPNGKMVSYVELPLHLKNYKSKVVETPFSKEEIDLIDYIPNLKVKKLILGPNSIFKKRSDFLEYEMWVKNKWKYNFEVEKSNIEF